MRRVIWNYLRAALIVAGAIEAGLALGPLVARTWPAAQWVRPACFASGTGMLLVAGIGRLGWTLQTIKGTSPAEKLDQAIFWILSIVGTFLLVLDYVMAK